MLALSTTLRGIPERQRSLRAVVQSSVEALSPQQQAFFVALCVFTGGWTAEAAAFVTELAETEAFLEELHQRSLVTVQEEERLGTMRFGFLEPLREFAQEQAPLSPQPAQRHAQYFLHVASQADENDVVHFDPLEGERENIEQALEWGWRETRDTAFWQGLAGFLCFAFVRGHHRRATLWAERAAQAWGTIPEIDLRLKVLHYVLMLYQDLGRRSEVEALRVALEHTAQEHDRPGWRVEALLHRGYLWDQRGQHEEALSQYREALALAQQQPALQPRVRALMLVNRAINPLAERLLPTAPEQALALFCEAEAASREALRLIGPRSRYHSILNLGVALSLAGQGKVTKAFAALKEAQRWALRHGTLAILMYTFYYEGLGEAFRGNPARAALLYGAYERLRVQMGYVIPPQAELTQSQQAVLAALGEEHYLRLQEQAQQCSLESLVGYAAKS